MKTCRNISVILCLVICFSNSLFVTSEDVLGCGGFLKSHVPIDFSKVEVKLITKQGIVKDKTNCAPNNGYYFVPLYDKGELILELSPPSGWSFTPKQVHLNVDGNDDCSLGKDINFVFEGFGITGKVESIGSTSGGPEGVIINLISQEGTKTTYSDYDGNFFFTPVFPGTYTVTISHPELKVYKKSVKLNVAQGNADIPPGSLVIQGYEATGKILTSEGQAVKDAIIVLYQNTDNKVNAFVEGCSKEKLTGIPYNDKYVCHTKSGSDGEFSFTTVPNGNYFLIPYYKEQNIYYQPDRIEFNVDHKSIELEDNFVIVGFSVPGKVYHEKNVPLENAKIFINDDLVAKSTPSGSYKLEKLKVGTYRLKAEADDYLFEEVMININTDSQTLPDLYPSAYKVCGSITSDHPQEVTFSQVGSTKFIQMKSGGDGKFCQYLSPGVYEIQVNVNEADKQKGLQFFPLKHVIEVRSKKISDFVFSQLKAQITGKIECIRKEDCINISVTLKSDSFQVTVPVKNSQYSVSDMHPGTYEISLTSTNYLCWKMDKQTVVVNSAVVEVPVFSQVGYSVEFVSSHDAKISYKSPANINRPETEIQLSSGVTKACLDTPGDYIFKLSSCHTYETDKIPYNTNSESNVITVNAEKHTLKLSVDSPSDFGDISISLKDINEDVSTKVVKYSKGKYEISLILSPGETIILTPQSEILYFEPRTLQIEGAMDCTDLGAKFKAVKGKVFKGKVVPPQQDVTIILRQPNDAILSTETDANGFYKFPPLEDSKNYKLEAEKENYILTGPDSEGNFQARKLAEIIVEVIDGADKSVLSGVLLSLSGSESYRRNLQTDINGKISFHSLSPSEYFLRPMMKEYQFEPNSVIIPVKEGETINVQLVGKRVAYSAFGSVTSLNEDPIENIIVIAAGINNCTSFSEQTATDNQGQFRIRGLQPYCSFKIYCQLSSEDKGVIERTTPSIEIKNIDKDEKGLKILVFHPISVLNVLVKVYAKNVDHYKSLKIRVYRENGFEPTLIYSGWVESSTGKVSKDKNTGIVVHLPNLPIDKKTYSVKLDSTSLKTVQQVKYFVANSSFKHLELDVVVKNNSTEQPIKQTSIWTLVFILFLLVGVYNIQIIFDKLRVHFNFNFGGLGNLINLNVNKPTPYYDDIDQIVQDINNIRKNRGKKNN